MYSNNELKLEAYDMSSLFLLTFKVAILVDQSTFFHGVERRRARQDRLKFLPQKCSSTVACYSFRFFHPTENHSHLCNTIPIKLHLQFTVKNTWPTTA